MGRWLKIAGTSLGLLLYVWIAAVRRADEVRARKNTTRLAARAGSRLP